MTTTDQRASVDVVRRFGRREVRARMAADDLASADLRLVRRDHVLVAGAPSRHRHELVLRVPRSVLAGPAQVEVVVGDGSGGTRVDRVTVFVPAR